MGFRGRREIVVIAWFNGACVPVVIVLRAFVLGVAIAVQVLMTVLGTATAPTATATAAATAISIVLALAIVFRSTIFVLGAVISGVLIVCLLIARATTAAAVPPTFPALLTAVRLVFVRFLILPIGGGAASWAIAATTISPASIAVAAAVAVLRATLVFFILVLRLGLRGLGGRWAAKEALEQAS